MPKVATNSVDLAFIPGSHKATTIATTTVVVKGFNVPSVHVDSKVIDVARLDTH